MMHDEGRMGDAGWCLERKSAELEPAQGAARPTPCLHSAADVCSNHASAYPMDHHEPIHVCISLGLAGRRSWGADTP